MPDPEPGPVAPGPAGAEPVDAGSRLDARERALELLYESDLKGRDVADVLAELPLAPDPFTASVVRLVGSHRADIDADLTRVSRGWTLERMPVVDRAILRLGLAELRWTPDVPVAVVINEAVELAKRFSTEASSRFVNGVLSRLAEEYRAPA